MLHLVLLASLCRYGNSPVHLPIIASCLRLLVGGCLCLCLCMSCVLGQGYNNRRADNRNIWIFDDLILLFSFTVSTWATYSIMYFFVSFSLRAPIIAESVLHDWMGVLICCHDSPHFPLVVSRLTYCLPLRISPGTHMASSGVHVV